MSSFKTQQRGTFQESKSNKFKTGRMLKLGSGQILARGIDLVILFSVG